MKRLLLLMFMVLGYMVPAQDNTVTKDLEKFAEVKGFDGISINLIKSTENKAVITGESTHKVAIVNNDGILKIRMQITKFFSGYKTFVDLYYTDDIMVIDVNEDARITSQDTIVQDVLELKAQEGGEVSVSTEVEQLLIKSVSGGIIKVTGKSNLQDVQINTGGIYEGEDLVKEHTTVAIKAAGNAAVNASEVVDAKVRAGGDIKIYGNPKKVVEDTALGGRITRIN